MYRYCVCCMQCNQPNFFVTNELENTWILYSSTMKSLHVQIVVLIILVVRDVSGETCQVKKDKCLANSQVCFKACTVTTTCEKCRAHSKGCASMCNTTQKNSGSIRSKKGNIKKLKRTIKKLLRLL